MWSGELVQVQQNDRNSDDDDNVYNDKDDDHHDDDNDDTVAGEAAVFPRQASQHLDWKKSKTTTELRMDGEISFVKKKLRTSDQNPSLPPFPGAPGHLPPAPQLAFTVLRGVWLLEAVGSFKPKGSLFEDEENHVMCMTYMSYTFVV